MLVRQAIGQILAGVAILGLCAIQALAQGTATPEKPAALVELYAVLMDRDVASS